MSAPSFSDENIKDYELHILTGMLRHPRLMQLGLTKMNQHVVRGRQQFHEQDFVFPIHNVIWDKAVEIYLHSGMLMPTRDMLVLQLNVSVGEGRLNPFELGPALETLWRIFSMDLPEAYIMGLYPDYLKYIRIRQVESRKAQGSYANEHEYIEAYQQALRDSVITSIFDKGAHPFVEIAMTPEERHRIPTNIGQLDKALGGGGGRGEVVVWVAVSGGGKTIALNQVSVNGARTAYNTFLGTCELPYERMRRRQYSYATGMEYGNFKIDVRQDEETMRRLAEAAVAIKNHLFIRDYTQEVCSLPLLDRDLSELIHRGWQPDLVVIDYLDKITPPIRRPDNPRIEFKELVEGLSRLAMRHNVCIHTATQANQKSVGKKILDLTSLSEAYGKVWAADIVIGVSDVQDVDGLPTIKQHLHTAKNRDNAKATIDVMRDYVRQRFITDEEYQRLLSSRGPTLPRAVTPGVQPNFVPPILQPVQPLV